MSNYKDKTKITVSNWLVLVIGIITFVCYQVLYNMNLEAGYWAGQTIKYMEYLGYAVPAACVLQFVLSLIPPKMIIGKITSIIADVLKIGIPAACFAAALLAADLYAEGLAYIFASNEEILATIQTPEVMQSAYVAIAMIACYAVAALIGLFTSFSGYTKVVSAEKQEKKAEKKEAKKAKKEAKKEAKKAAKEAKAA